MKKASQTCRKCCKGGDVFCWNGRSSGWSTRCGCLSGVYIFSKQRCRWSLLNRLLRRSVSASPSTMWQRRLWPNWHGVTAEDHTSVCGMYLKYMISLWSICALGTLYLKRGHAILTPVQLLFCGQVDINVGGVIFEASRHTFTQQPGSNSAAETAWAWKNYKPVVWEAMVAWGVEQQPKKG